MITKSSTFVIYVLGDLDLLPMIEYASTIIKDSSQELNFGFTEIICRFIANVIDDKTLRVVKKRSLEYTEG